ncbi:MAG: acyltransferase family protein, partial [Bacteroidota bacterium]|nr:acyltransferase family protein [Bacteroidota bacterium]
IVPLHLFIWQKYYNQDIVYSIQVSHLWFLANIFIYVVVLSPLFFYLMRNDNMRFARWLKRLFSSPMGLLFITSAFVVEAILIKPESFETYSMTLHGFLLGLLAFLFGFVVVQSGEGFWQTVKRWRWVLLLLAVALYVVRLIEFDLMAPNYLKAIESNMWIFAVFGFGYTYLNKQSKVLSYLSQAAYPVYILHMIFLYLGSWLLVPLQIPIYLKLVGVMVITFTGCFVFYEFLIRRVRFLRPLFGLKNI